MVKHTKSQSFARAIVCVTLVFTATLSSQYHVHSANVRHEPSSVDGIQDDASAPLGTSDTDTDAAGAISQDIAVSGCLKDRVGEENMPLCEAAAAVLAGEVPYKTAIKNIEGTHNLTAEKETKEVFENVLAIIEDSLNVLSSAGDEPTLGLGDAAIANRTNAAEAEAMSGVSEAISMLDSTSSLFAEVTKSRDVWRSTVTAAADARSEFLAKLESYEKERNREKAEIQSKLAVVLNETTKVQATLNEEMKTAKKMAISAKNAVAKGTLPAEKIDELMKFSRQATTAAAATKRYLDLLELRAKAMREEIQKIEEKDSMDNLSANAPAPDPSRNSILQADEGLNALQSQSQEAADALSQIVLEAEENVAPRNQSAGSGNGSRVEDTSHSDASMPSENQ